jgi:hypothetical protein
MAALGRRRGLCLLVTTTILTSLAMIARASASSASPIKGPHLVLMGAGVGGMFGGTQVASDHIGHLSRCGWIFKTQT